MVYIYFDIYQNIVDWLYWKLQIFNLIFSFFVYSFVNSCEFVSKWVGWRVGVWVWLWMIMWWWAYNWDWQQNELDSDKGSWIQKKVIRPFDKIDKSITCRVLHFLCMHAFLSSFKPLCWKRKHCTALTQIRTQSHLIPSRPPPLEYNLPLFHSGFPSIYIISFSKFLQNLCYI